MEKAIHAMPFAADILGLTKRKMLGSLDISWSVAEKSYREKGINHIKINTMT